MESVYILAAVRAPIGKFGGTLKEISPVDLAAHAMQAALAQAGVDGMALDLFVFGNILIHGHGQLVPHRHPAPCATPV